MTLLLERIVVILLGGVAAIYEHRSACDKGSGVGAEEDNHGGDLLSGAQALHGMQEGSVSEQPRENWRAGYTETFKSGSEGRVAKPGTATR